MTSKEVISRLEDLIGDIGNEVTLDTLDYEALKLGIKALEENTALNLLVDWAIQCDFGFDNFPEEYEKYKEDIKELGYKEGMIYIAKKETRGDV